MKEKLERKIHFYQVVGSLSNKGKAKKVDMLEIFLQLKAIQESEEDNFMEWGDDDALGFWIDSQEYPLKISFGKIRIKNLPRKKRGLALEDLVLKQDEGLVELTHFIFYDNGIAAVEYNYYGPRPSAFSDYVWNKFRTRLKFHTIYNQEAEQLIDSFNGIFEFQIKVTPSLFSQSTEAGKGLFEGLESITEGVDSDSLELRIKNYMYLQKGGNKKSLPARITSVCKRMVRNGRSRYGVDKLVIAGNVEGIGKQTRNLLEDAFVFSRKIVKLNNSKAVSSSSMFKALDDVFKEHQDKILKSLIIEYEDKN